MAQPEHRVTFSGYVRDGRNGEGLEAATLQLFTPQGGFRGTVTDKTGAFILQVFPGNYRLVVSFVGYVSLEQQVEIKEEDTAVYFLKPSLKELGEVVVTAMEMQSATTQSRISADAMKHRQPTSFADLLSLLPGGVAEAPAIGKASLIRLRQAGEVSEDYDISSLGTAFVIDGYRLPTDANMQEVAQVSSSSTDSYSQLEFANRGIDMRSLSTDQIESVEIVRGVSSAEYGDLTGGLVKIHRKKGYTPWSARLKADQYGKLFALGKGIEWKEKKLSINMGLDYMDARPDPRDDFSTYKRLTASVRLYKSWKEWSWALSAGYTGSADDRKKDPEVTLQKDDRYRASYRAMTLGNTFRWETERKKFIDFAELVTYINYQQDQIRQTKFVALDRDRLVPGSLEAGEHDGLFLPYKYTAHLLVDGNPFAASAKLKTGFSFSYGAMRNKALLGIEWNMDKNYGRGQVYDATRPLNPGTSLRPVSYKEIPAGHKIAFFAEDRADFFCGTHRLKLTVGLRGLMLSNLSGRYVLSNRMYFDPRVSAQWQLPVTGKGLKISLSGSAGWQTKMPTLQQLYPYRIYKDIIQLNYFDMNPDYRRLNIWTEVIDPVNYDLKPARNRKWEVKADLSYCGHGLSVTYFREILNSGFRYSAKVRPYRYKKYDAAAIDPGNLQGPPDLNKVPWNADTVLGGYSRVTNGSSLWKEGVEFQLVSRRIESLRTKLTLNGAWFKTTYKNSQPMFDPGVTTAVVNGIPVQDKYVGFYDWTEGYEKQQLTNTFILDTQLKPLGLTFSTWVECRWFESSRRLRQNGMPVAYMDVTGEIQAYTPADREDVYKQWLVKQYNEEIFRKMTVPFCMYVHFKATKDFGKFLTLALFADRLLDYTPDYQSNGYTIRRNSTPYFGMELNFRL